MRGGANAAVAEAERTRGPSLGRTVRGAGAAWGERAGGTSGALWGRPGGDWRRAGQPGQLFDGDAAAAVTAFADAIDGLGGAEPGDKTLVDALIPFHEAFLARSTSESPSGCAAAAVGRAGGRGRTADLRPSRGAHGHSPKTAWSPDPGAVSFAISPSWVTRHVASVRAKPEPATSDTASGAGNGGQGNDWDGRSAHRHSAMRPETTIRRP